MALNLYRSNRTESLCDSLAERLRAPTNQPLMSRWLVVQGHGMGAFLSQQLAARLGVWGGGEFLYPRNFMREAMRRILPAETKTAGFSLDQDALMWRILKTLPGVVEQPWAEPLRNYIGHDPEGVRRLHLARQIANAFDQYQTYRPDWLEEWAGSDGELAVAGDEVWQAALWRTLVADYGFGYLAAFEADIHQQVERSTTLDLPSPVHFFGLSTMPPVYLRILVSLARIVDINLYLLAPDASYYGDLLSPGQRRRAERHQAADELHLGHVHPLINSLGRVGAQFLEMVLNAAESFEVQLNEYDVFQPSRCPGPLGDVQRSLMGQTDSLPPSAGAPTSEQSLIVHSCHGPIREVEVLHDQLLSQFVNGDLEPHDVVVMMTDVQTYAPLVDAVFGRYRGTDRFIPYRLVDRTLRGESRVAESLLGLLDLGGSRFEVTRVMELLRTETVAQRFGFSDEQCDEIENWLGDMSVAWALDEEHRQRCGQPASRQNTWSYGLERLLLGYAMSGRNHERFAGVAPYDPVEVAQPDTLEGFLSFCQVLVEIEAMANQVWPFVKWRERVRALLERCCVQTEHNAWEHRRIGDALDAIAQRLEEANFAPTMASVCWGMLLQEQLEQPAPLFGFSGGGVTCCAMVPMRAIPFPVVCVLGMDDKSFPRPDRRSSFNLIGQRAARLGDRSRRDDDRYLFLEALLSARRQAIVCYSGQSARDNSDLPASVVLSELLNFASSDDESLVVRHPLQPFSSRYFDGSDERLFSFEDSYLQALGKKKQARPGVRVELFERILERQDEDVIALAELRAFFASPVQYLLKRRLGVDLRSFRRKLSDREPLVWTPLERYRVDEQLLALQTDGVDDTKEQLHALGLLPLGTPGTQQHRQRSQGVRDFVACLKRHGLGTPQAAAAVDLELDGNTRLVGHVGQRYSEGRLAYRLGSIRAKDLLLAWIDHLAMAAADDAVPTWIIGRADKAKVAVQCFSSVDEPKAEINRLVGIYRMGLCEPLFFFPEASLAFAKKYLRGGEGVLDEALDTARKEYKNGEWQRDAHLQRVFHQRDIFSWSKGLFEAPSFVTLARSVFEPLLRHSKKGTP